MAYLGNSPARNFISFERQVFTIVNSQTAYTLDHSVNNENDLRLVINNIVQEPGSGKAYTASGTTLTLSAALVNGTDEMYCVFLGRAVATNAPGAGSVGTSQLASDAVTEAKIADDAVESEHLNDNVISGQTELASAPASTDELLISDAGTLKRIDVSLVGGDNTPAFYAYMSANQTSIADTTRTIVAFNAELFDTDSAYDTSTYKFTVPSGKGGKYLIGFRIAPYFHSDKGYQFQMNLLINGSTLLEFGKIDEPSNSNSRYGGTSTESIILDLSAGDYIQAEIYANTVGNNAYIISQTGSAQSVNYFYGYKLIGI
jgi:hypothetical protein